ncbi:hypothetical protein BaRGS_00032191 [Batillaria attramentaria]|uniref:Uncharacterized protein n=1 Tax=Batillaria attramentaria TaxID=370345 RepID=A0ABD0JNC6_9CAEN
MAKGSDMRSTLQYDASQSWKRNHVGNVMRASQVLGNQTDLFWHWPCKLVFVIHYPDLWECVKCATALEVVNTMRLDLAGVMLSMRYFSSI